MADSRRLFIIGSELGMHLRPASQFVKAVKDFSCRVTVSKDGVDADGKSVLALMTLAAAQGDTLEIGVEGEEAECAMNAIAALQIWR